MLHNVLSIALPVGTMLALSQVSAWYGKRPAVKARVAALGMRETIARNIRILQLAIVVQAGFLAAYLGLHLAGVLTFAGWLAGSILAFVFLAVDVLMLTGQLGARRRYDNLGPLAYLAEVQYAFGRKS